MGEALSWIIGDTLLGKVSERLQKNPKSENTKSQGQAAQGQCLNLGQCFHLAAFSYSEA